MFQDSADDADASKHVGVFTLYKILFICCAFVGLDSKQLHYFNRQIYSTISCQLACSISVSHLSGSPTTLPGVINYTLHSSDQVTDPVDLLFTEDLAVVVN